MYSQPRSFACKAPYMSPSWCPHADFCASITSILFSRFFLDLRAASDSATIHWDTSTRSVGQSAVLAEAHATFQLVNRQDMVALRPLNW